MASRALALSLFLVTTTAASAATARPVAEIRQAQIAAASRAHAAALAAYAVGTGHLEAVYQWSVRWMQAERATTDRLAIGRHRARMDVLSAEVSKRIAVGLASPADSDAVAYYLAEAELWSTGEL
jgi:hypothetical protein